MREWVSEGIRDQGLVFKFHRLLYHSTLGSSVIRKRKKGQGLGAIGIRISVENH